MRLSLTTVYNIPDQFAEDFIVGLRMGGVPLMDPDILKKGRQVIEVEGEFVHPKDPEKPIKVPIITIIEAGTLQ